MKQSILLRGNDRATLQKDLATLDNLGEVVGKARGQHGGFVRR
jgi:hypothetical protein